MSNEAVSPVDAGPAVQDPHPDPSPAPPRGSIVGVAAGNAVEWFDWAIYATFASFIAAQLFSPENPASAFLATLAVFAVGFAARPLGAALFGGLGDRIGRKPALIAAIGLASLGSLLIGIVPSFESIGVWSSLILVGARLLQGLAHGGEMPSAQTYLAEIAPPERRGLYTSILYVSGTLGVIAGTLMGAILSVVLPADQMSEWGWRIPFLVGAALGLWTVIMRSRVNETEQFASKREAESTGPRESLLAQVWKSRRLALQIIGLNIGLTVVFYIWSVATPAHAIVHLGMSPAAALWVGVAANAYFIVLLPLWGRLSDRIGRKPVMLISVIGSIVLQFPMTWLVQGEWWQLLFGMMGMLTFISAAAAILPAMMTEMFPTSIRTIGVAIPYAVAVALFGGTAAFLQAGFDQWFGESGGTVFSFYAIILLAITAFTVTRVPETRGKVL